MKVDRKKFLIGTGVVILAVAAFGIANPNNGTHSQNARAKELAKELDETVTEDSIQGTYVTDVGNIFAIDIKYQKIHMDELSKCSEDRDDHFYLSDSIMCEGIKFCREISENKATAKYIVLYADSKARRFYERNLFTDFSEFMKKESNMEINKNDPMYMLLE